MRLTSSFLQNYRFHGTAPERLERVLAVGRTFLTVAALGAIYLDPTEPTRLAAVTYGVLFSYVLYSGIVLAWVHSGAHVAPTHGRLLHAGDILWASALTFVSEGPVSPFFLFFLFVVAASAYRWGFRETIATATVTAGIFLIETGIASVGPWNRTWFGSIDFELNRTILRVAYLLLTGFLLGYLAEEEKQARAELAAIADLPRQPRVDLGLRGSVTAVTRGLLQTFDAAAVAIVLREQETGVSVLWRLERSPAPSVSSPAERTELDAEGEAAWLFDDPARAWHAMIGTRDEAAFRVSDPGAWQLRRVQAVLPPTVTMDGSPRTLTAVNIGLPDEWRGRVYLFDIGSTDSIERCVHFLEAVTEHFTPALTNLFLYRKVRSRDSAAERARVARELHDGAIQALFGIEMKLEALRRRPARTVADHDHELAEVQELVRREVLALRVLMRALRPIELDANEKLAEVLLDVVERFRRESGVSARFVASGAIPSFHPATAIEIVRIVQEALVNVRKHSRAINVLVRLTCQDGQCRLVIEDDGRGFDFEGLLSASELDLRRVGPTIIKERARVLGADLTVHSTRGVGARVELVFSEKAEKMHA